MKVPVIDLALCVDCEGCIELCPDVFIRNPVGMIEVALSDTYPVDEVQDAIKYCPADCISWEDG